MKTAESKTPTAFIILILISGILIIANGAYNMFTSSFFAVSFDLTFFIFHFLPGITMFVSGIFLLRYPTHNISVGLFAVLLALFSILSGGGFLFGLVAGLLGATLTLAWKSNMLLIRPIKTKLMTLNAKKQKIILITSIALLFMIVTTH